MPKSRFIHLTGEGGKTQPLYTKNIHAQDKQAFVQHNGLNGCGASVSSSVLSDPSPMDAYRAKFADAPISALRSACKAYGIPHNQPRQQLIDQLLEQMYRCRGEREIER